MFCVVERTAIATRLAVRTVFNIHKEFNPDLFDRAVILSSGSLVLFTKVLGKVMEACSFPGGKFCL